MGRKSKLAELEAQIGTSLSDYILKSTEEGLTPEEIASNLGISKSSIYNYINELELKPKIKEINQRKSRRGADNELEARFQQFIENRKVQNVSQKTITGYTGMFGNYVWWLNEKNIRLDLSEGFNSLAVQSFLNYLMTATDRWGGTSVSARTEAKPRTVGAYRKLFNAFGNYLVQMGVLDKNPVARVPVTKVPKEVPEDASDEEIKTIINHFDVTFSGIRNKTMTMVLLDTGMRRGGLASLQIDTIDPETGWGVIEEKGGKERYLKLSPIALEQLRLYIRVREPIARVKSLWVSTDGGEFGYDSIKLMYYNLNKKIKIQNRKGIHAHLFRHVFTKWMAQKEVSLLAMMKMAGWENVELAQHYAAAYSAKKAFEQHDAASPIENLFGGTDNEKGQSD